MSGCWQLWILNWLQRDNWWCNESLLVNALVVSRLHERCHLVCRHSHISYQVVVKLKSAMVKKKLHYPSEKVGLFWNLLVTAVRRHFYFEGEHSVLFWVTFLQVSLQFSHCKQPKQLQDGFCRKTLTAWPRPFSKRLLGVAGSVVKTFIVPYRNFFISALARTTCMENITNRLPFYLQFANLSANKNNMLPTSMQSEGGNVLENKTVAWKFLVQHRLCNRFHLATVKKKSSNHSLPGWGIFIFL